MFTLIGDWWMGRGQRIKAARNSGYRKAIKIKNIEHKKIVANLNRDFVAVIQKQEREAKTKSVQWEVNAKAQFDQTKKENDKFIKEKNLLISRLEKQLEIKDKKLQVEENRHLREEIRLQADYGKNFDNKINYYKEELKKYEQKDDQRKKEFDTKVQTLDELERKYIEIILSANMAAGIYETNINLLRQSSGVASGMQNSLKLVLQQADNLKTLADSVKNDTKFAKHIDMKV